MSKDNSGPNSLYVYVCACTHFVKLLPDILNGSHIFMYVCVHMCVHVCRKSSFSLT